MSMCDPKDEYEHGAQSYAELGPTPGAEDECPDCGRATWGPVSPKLPIASGTVQHYRCDGCGAEHEVTRARVPIMCTKPGYGGRITMAEDD